MTHLDDLIDALSAHDAFDALAIVIDDRQWRPDLAARYLRERPERVARQAVKLALQDKAEFADEVAVERELVAFINGNLDDILEELELC